MVDVYFCVNVDSKNEFKPKVKDKEKENPLKKKKTKVKSARRLGPRWFHTHKKFRRPGTILSALVTNISMAASAIQYIPRIPRAVLSLRYEVYN